MATSWFDKFLKLLGIEEDILVLTLKPLLTRQVIRNCWP